AGCTLREEGRGTREEESCFRRRGLKSPAWRSPYGMRSRSDLRTSAGRATRSRSTWTARWPDSGSPTSRPAIPPRSLAARCGGHGGALPGHGRRRGTPVGGSLTAALRLEGVSFSYGAVRALAEVSFTLAPGERVALLGRNGAGKSTLMKVVTRLVRPTAGIVW